MTYQEESPQYIARLCWLMRLRWLALLGVSGAAVFAVLGVVPGLNLEVTLIAVFLGIASNVYIRWQISLREEVDLESLHVGQAILDTLVLSLVLWAAGGSDSPFISFYIFPVLLAALLSGSRTFWPTAVASLCGLFWQELSVLIPLLRIGVWNPPSPWDDVLNLLAITITIGMAAYFAAQFTDTLREQVLARRAADALFHLAFERLEAGVELIEQGEIMWQNSHAVISLGHREHNKWRCPGYGKKRACVHQESGCVLSGELGPTRCQFSLDSPLTPALSPNSPTSIYELMVLSPPKHRQRIALYVERTAEVAYQQKLMHTERLASLGRTAQGVAHELNTPLATIQTLGRDLIDALELAQLPHEVREDIEESAQVIIEEVQRCSRITHALLGRAELNKGGYASLTQMISRSIALVFPHEKQQVLVDLKDLSHLQYPLDPIVQIFVNLLQNAADVSPKDQIIVNAQERGKGEIEISVIDRGGGLDESSISMIFEPFYTTKSPGQGTGLGLYTSYALAQELNGELTLMNNDIGGVTASLRLPLSSIPP